jgi:hypothetical protein
LQENPLSFGPGDTVVMSLDRLSGEFSAAIIGAGELGEAKTSEAQSLILQDVALNRLQLLGKISFSDVELNEASVEDCAELLPGNLFPAASLLMTLQNHVVKFHEINLLRAKLSEKQEGDPVSKETKVLVDMPLSCRRIKAEAEEEIAHIRLKLWTAQTNRAKAQRAALAYEPKLREQFFRDMVSFSEKADIEIVMLLSAYANKIQQERPTVQTHEISIEAVPLDRDTVLIDFPSLWSYEETTLRSRMHILHALNRVVRRNIAIFDWTEAFRAKEDRRPESVSNSLGLGTRLHCHRGLIYTSTKTELWTQALNLTMQTSGDSHNPNAGLEFGIAPRMRPSMHCSKSSQTQVTRPKITIDRLLDFENASSSRESIADGESVMQQTMHNFGYGRMSPIGLRQRERAFHVHFKGERSVDVGGPYREVLTQILVDMERDGVLVPTSNNRDKVGTFQDRLIPNPHIKKIAGGSMKLEYSYVFVGQIIGIALRTNNPIVLNMPPLIWKLLVGQEVDREDLRALDIALLKRHDAILSEETEFEMGEANAGAAKSEGAKIIALREQTRLTELARCTTAMRTGIATICPLRLVELFSWLELQFLVCRSADIDVQELRRLTRYKSGLSEKHPSVVLLWKVLEGFTQSEKVRFLRFVSGQARLSSKFVLTIVPLKGRHRVGVRPLPEASTCFSVLELPTWPHSVDELREKLLYAVSNCKAIDADGDA